MNQPLVYIILLIWNDYVDTVECIESLKNITYKNYKILLVDNASTTNDFHILMSKYPEYESIKNATNLGFSGGVNVGIKHALKNNAEYILLLNNDTYVAEDFLSVLVSIGETDEKVGILSPFMYYANSNKIWSSGYNLNLRMSWPFYDENRQVLDNGQYTKIRDVDLLVGCSMLIKKEVFRKVGFFKEEYFLYIEDMDFSYRVKQHNLSLYSVPDSKIWHKIGRSSSKKGISQIRYYFSRNLILFIKYNQLKKQNLISLITISKWYMLEILTYLKILELGTVKSIIIGIIHGLIGRTGSY